MRLRTALAWVAACATLAIGAQAQADAIPYPDSGTYNATAYTFKATKTGDLLGYFAGSSAAYDNEVGVLDNGVLTSGGFGLDNKSSAVGQSFDFGAVTAGDTLVFVLQDNTLGEDAYSDPALNTAYDAPGDTIGHNHVYSTAYTATNPVFAGVPAGTYVGFEDLPIPGADFNYNDETFVFAGTSVAPVGAAPEPSTWVLMILGLGGVGVALRQAKRSAARNREDAVTA